MLRAMHCKLVFLAESVPVTQAMMIIPEIITPCPIAEPASKVAGFEPHVPATVTIDRERVENLRTLPFAPA